MMILCQREKGKGRGRGENVTGMQNVPDEDATRNASTEKVGKQWKETLCISEKTELPPPNHLRSKWKRSLYQATATSSEEKIISQGVEIASQPENWPIQPNRGKSEKT